MGDRYIQQLSQIDASIKRLNSQTAELRKKKKDILGHLHTWMVRNGHEKYGSYTVTKIAPKPPAKRKPAKAKKLDAMALFQQVGIDDPEQFWEELARTQKAVIEAPTDGDFDE